MIIIYFPIKKATQLSLFDRKQLPTKQVLVRESTGKTHIQNYHVSDKKEVTIDDFEKLLGLNIEDDSKTDKIIQRWIVKLGHGKVCNRCLGTGSYLYNQRYGNTCFKCGGTGHEQRLYTKELYDKIKKDVESGEFKKLHDTAILAYKISSNMDEVVNNLKLPQSLEYPDYEAIEGLNRNESIKWYVDQAKDSMNRVWYDARIIKSLSNQLNANTFDTLKEKQKVESELNERLLKFPQTVNQSKEEIKNWEQKYLDYIAENPRQFSGENSNKDKPIDEGLKKAIVNECFELGRKAYERAYKDKDLEYYSDIKFTQKPTDDNEFLDICRNIKDENPELTRIAIRAWWSGKDKEWADVLEGRIKIEYRKRKR